MPVSAEIVPTSAVLVEQHRKQIYAAIEAERNRQITLGHTADHDAELSESQWISIIVREVGLAMGQGGIADDPKRFDRQMIRLGAVVIAVLQARAGIHIEGNVIGPTDEQRGPGY